MQFFKYKCRDKNVFQANEICKCKVPFHIPNQNFCSTLMKMMRSGMYIRNSNRSDNRKRTHLYILQLILRAFKLEFVNGLQLNLFLAFLELCSRSLYTANFDIFNGYDHTLKFR